MTSSMQVAIDERLLVIDDSLSLGRLVQTSLGDALGVPVDLAASLAEATVLCERSPMPYRIAVVDLHLPDAGNGEAVDLMLRYGITVIVLTGTLDPALRERIIAKPVSDYVIKQHPGSIDAVVRSVKSSIRNRGRKALLVHAAGSFRDFLQRLLEVQGLVVEALAAEDEVLGRLQADETIQLLVVDHDLPRLDGVALTSRVSARFPQERVAIIGLSELTDPFLGVQFLKAGASDLLRKPFVAEELLSRVNNCLNHLDTIQTVREQANRDYLTGLYNRRYFHEIGKTLFSSARRGQVTLSAAMIDIDHFKAINDGHGHEAGDRVIIAVAKALASSFRGSDVVARMGGEEFCVLAVNADQPVALFERLRERIQGLAIQIPNGKLPPINITVSIGVSMQLGEGMDGLVGSADRMLYLAKQQGRNRVVSDLGV